MLQTNSVIGIQLNWAIKKRSIFLLIQALPYMLEGCEGNRKNIRRETT